MIRDRDPGKTLTNTYLDALAKAGGNLDGPRVIYLDPSDSVDEPFNDHTWVVCEVCRVPLNRLTDPEGVETWLHSRTWRDYDHDPVPIGVDRNETRDTTCDFCGVDTDMHWVYTGERLRMGAGNTVHDYGRHWSACADCGALINDSDFAGLSQRALRMSPTVRGLSRAERLEMVGHYKSLWGQFFPTVTDSQYIGPRREPAKLNPRLMPKLQQGLVKFWKNPTLYDALNRPDRQTTLPLPGVHNGEEDEFLVRFGPGVAMSPTAWKNHVDHIVAGIWAASDNLYWVSTEFTRLATMAGKEFDKISLTREELPATFGFMIFEEPIGEIQRPLGMAHIRGVSWTLIPEGVWLNLYIQGEDCEPDIDVEQMRAEFGWLMCPNTGSGIPFGSEIERIDGPQYDIAATILATWFLMRQPGVAEHSKAPVDKKAARSFQRTNNRPLPDVQLVDLRRQPRRPGSDTETHEGRKLTVRVYRRGHWKRQFYGPGRAMRKTIYISGYIAGPENAPLKDSPRKVKIVR